VRDWLAAPVAALRRRQAEPDAVVAAMAETNAKVAALTAAIAALIDARPERRASSPTPAAPSILRARSREPRLVGGGVPEQGPATEPAADGTRTPDAPTATRALLDRGGAGEQVSGGAAPRPPTIGDLAAAMQGMRREIVELKEQVRSARSAGGRGAGRGGRGGDRGGYGQRNTATEEAPAPVFEAPQRGRGGQPSSRREPRGGDADAADGSTPGNV